MTIFDTPVVRHFFRLIAWIIFLVVRWRPGPPAPETIKKSVLVAAPHTSNWDFGLFLAVVFGLNMRVRVLIKHTLFVGPAGWLLRYCGGIAIDRRSTKNYVKMMANEFAAHDTFHLVVTPEGTRGPQTHWKKGFYHIAVAANVPIILTAIDAETRRIGAFRILYPEGDIEADMAEIYAFYDNYTGLKPHNYASPNKPAPKDA